MTKNLFKNIMQSYISARKCEGKYKGTMFVFLNILRTAYPKMKRGQARSAHKFLLKIAAAKGKQLTPLIDNLPVGKKGKKDRNIVEFRPINPADFHAMPDRPQFNKGEKVVGQDYLIAERLKILRKKQQVYRQLAGLVGKTTEIRTNRMSIVGTIRKDEKGYWLEANCGIQIQIAIDSVVAIDGVSISMGDSMTQEQWEEITVANIKYGRKVGEKMGVMYSISEEEQINQALGVKVKKEGVLSDEDIERLLANLQ